MHLPFIVADLAFTQLYLGPVLVLKIVGLPSFKIFALLWAMDFCWNDHLGSHTEINFFKFFYVYKIGVGRFSRFFGKLFQNECGGAAYHKLLNYWFQYI